MRACTVDVTVQNDLAQVTKGSGNGMGPPLTVLHADQPGPDSLGDAAGGEMRSRSSPLLCHRVHERGQICVFPLPERD